MPAPLYRYGGALIDFISPTRAERLFDAGRAKLVRHKKGAINRVILHRMPGHRIRFAAAISEIGRLFPGVQGMNKATGVEVAEELWPTGASGGAAQELAQESTAGDLRRWGCRVRPCRLSGLSQRVFHSFGVTGDDSQ